MKIPLYISTYNRDDITLRSLTSLFNSSTPEDIEVIIMDDGSNENLQAQLRSVALEYKWTYQVHRHIGIPLCKVMRIAQDIRIRKLVEKVPYFLVTDADMLYSKDWITALVKLYQETQQPVITGFDTRTNQHDLIDDHGHYCTKTSIGGANLLIAMDYFEKHPFKIGEEWDWALTTDVKKYGGNLICTLPSIVEHIGHVGAKAIAQYHDKAVNFIGEEVSAMEIFK